MQQCAHGQGSSKALPPALLDVLASQLLQQDLTSIIAVYFSPILVDLAARLLPADSQGSWQDGQIQATVHAFATLLAPFPAIYPMVYRLLHHPALHSEPLYAILPILERREASRLLLSIARLGLASAPLLYSFKSQLPPAALETIFQDRNGWPAAARLLAVQLFSEPDLESEAEGFWMCFSDDCSVNVPTCDKCKVPFQPYFMRRYRYDDQWECPSCKVVDQPTCLDCKAAITWVAEPERDVEEESDTGDEDDMDVDDGSDAAAKASRRRGGR